MLTPGQIADRRNGIGGSDAGAVLGADRYLTRLQLYRQKIGEVEPAPPNAAMKRGTYLEPIARRLYKELTGRRVIVAGRRRHATMSWMTCNVDGFILGVPGKGKGVLEIKCPSIGAYTRIKRTGLPSAYIAQMQHNLEVTGCKWGAFAVFNADLWELAHFDVDYEPELVALLVEREREFWHDHVLMRIPPLPDALPPEIADALAAAAKLAGTGDLVVRNDQAWGDAARRYIDAEDLAATADELMSEAEEQLKAAMGDKGVVEGAGLRVYWKEQEGRKSLDKDALAAAYPQIDLGNFEKRGKPFATFRTFRVPVGVGD